MIVISQASWSCQSRVLIVYFLIQSVSDAVFLIIHILMIKFGRWSGTSKPFVPSIANDFLEYQVGPKVAGCMMGVLLRSFIRMHLKMEVIDLSICTCVICFHAVEMKGPDIAPDNRTIALLHLNQPSCGDELRALSLHRFHEKFFIDMGSLWGGKDNISDLVANWKIIVDFHETAEKKLLGRISSRMVEIEGLRLEVANVPQNSSTQLLCEKRQG